MSTKSSKVAFDRIEIGGLPNCRSTLDGIAELAADISDRGLLQPLVVWHRRLKREAHVLPDGRSVWDRYILIAGHRRYAAIESIRAEDPKAFESVPVTLFAGNEDDARFAQLAENLQRDDLSVSDVALAISGMVSRGYTQKDVAKRLSRSQAWVSRMNELATGAEREVLHAIDDGTLTIAKGLEIAQELPQSQRAAVNELRADKANGKQVKKPPAPRRKSARQLRVLLDAIRQDGSTPPSAEDVILWVLGESDVTDDGMLVAVRGGAA